MEHLYAIRGWVEGDSQIVEGVRSFVATSPLARHWHFSSPAVGEIGFAFLGVVVKGSGRAEVREQLSRIASQVASNFSDVHENARGYFQVTCLNRVEASRAWRFGGGVFVEVPPEDAD